MRRKVKVEASKTVYTHSYLYIAAVEALKQAKNSEEGRFYTCMTAELFSAFCVEAFLNYFGKEKVSHWEKLEKKLSPLEKLEIICDEIELKVDFEKRPFQSFNSMFKLRNLMVHGKPEHLFADEVQHIRKNEKPKLPETKWETLINLKTASKFTEDTQKMFETIREKSGIKRNTLLTLTSASWVIRQTENE
jgi:hypothetical protein